ncbi:hypothetical protein DFS34DRAFT_493950 [Phlyctochytrium arcticum]|nr:hypothetical protein DFS34DRAFT_493950 [Phlyctochytrium arcticum]
MDRTLQTNPISDSAQVGVNGSGNALLGPTLAEAVSALAPAKDGTGDSLQQMDVTEMAGKGKRKREDTMDVKLEGEVDTSRPQSPAPGAISLIGASTADVCSNVPAAAAQRLNEEAILDKNEDYQLLSSTLTVLRNQLEQAQTDLQALLRIKEEALQEPFTFVDKLLNKTLDTIPKPQQVVPIPYIDWDRYPNIDRERLNGRVRSMTRTIERVDSPGWMTPPVPLGPLDPSELNTPPPPTAAPSAAQMERTTSENARIAEDRSQSFNQPWSEEEHSRLIELLEIYPDEPIHARRCEKIAAALGSRNAKQVSSRIQKFVDERRVKTPGGSSRNSRRSSGKPTSTRVSGAFYSNRVSGASYLKGPPVTMSDDEGDQEDLESKLAIDPQLKGSEEYKELMRLQKLVKQKTATVPAAHTADPVHYGFSCDRCSAEPIVGIRWKCLECPEESQVDLCDDCINKNFTNELHSASHRFEKIEVPDQTIVQNEFSYLGFRPVE